MSTIAPIKRRYATVELQDGTIHTDIRVVMADDRAWSAYSRGLNAKQREDRTEQGVFMVWNALRRNGLTDSNYARWADEELLDFAVETVDDDAGEHGEDPTSV